MYLDYWKLIVGFCSDEHSGKVKSFMLDVLSPLITESDNVSTQLLDIILINIVEPQKSSKKNAYFLAKELIIKTNETMEQYITQVSFYLCSPKSYFLPQMTVLHLIQLNRFISVFQSSFGHGQSE